MDPMEIEKKSFQIISRELGNKKLMPGTEDIVKRVIHCSADFDYADNLVFSENVVPILRNAFLHGCNLVTDTMMAKSGISKPAAEKLGINIHCFIADKEVAQKAKERGITRAAAAIEYGDIRSYLQGKGTPIGPLDMLIAAHAKAEKTVLVTNNVREFKRVPGLKIENWVE